MSGRSWIASIRDAFLGRSPGESAQPVENPYDLVRNYYVCPECGFRWQEVWDSEFDDTCIKCGLDDVSPIKSKPLIEE